MEQHIEIEIDNRRYMAIAREAIYMEEHIWELTVNDKKHLVRKVNNRWTQAEGDGLNNQHLQLFGEAVERLTR